METAPAILIISFAPDVHYMLLPSDVGQGTSMQMFLFSSFCLEVA